MSSNFRILPLAWLVLLLMPGGPVSAAPRVIELTQVPCQFLEPENGVDHGYESRSADDCIAINERTADGRLDVVEPMVLPPGEYIFRVKNRSVPYALGFWLRGDGLVARAALPSVSGGGLSPGTSRDYAITLEPGEYVYSCPLNPTPDYPIVVRQ
ncbi:MAG: hypothetical protein R3298_07740 [Gammaproteobacteria bacterium]|nr:hypothetical protein [Gammaproteobacteria bacterium]